MRRLSVLALSAALTFAAGLSAQDIDDPDVRLTASDGAAGMSFTGDDIRVGVGIDDDGDVHGEYFHVFGEDFNSAWIGELWAAEDRGGIKLNYHWLSGASSFEEAITAESGVSIRKTFLAIDQNEFDDRKATIGFGSETPSLFWGAYVNANLTGHRLVDQTLITDQEVISFIDNGQVFEQIQFTDTITRIFEKPYNYGVGARIGRYFDGPLVRLRGGLDYEDGDFGADQTTLSVGIEKYFANTGHSLALTAEYLDKSGDFEVDDSDTRALLMYRYSFGDRYQPVRDTMERRIEVADGAGDSAVSTQTERRPVRNRIEVTDEAYFDFDKSFIRPDARGTLSEVIREIQAKEIVSDILVVGHTCNIGTVEYNQGLSERRAASAVGFLVDAGIDRSAIKSEGRSELQPKYSNATEDTRKLNRRVEIEFISMETGVEEVEVEVREPDTGRIRWQREPINDPAWMERALRNPVQHKRNVDTYRFQETETVDRTSAPVLVNTLPQAVDDQATTLRETPVSINVLANDIDADNDPLVVVSVSQPGNGSATDNGNGSVTYTPADGFVGTDTFTYTAADPTGAQTTATVTVIVTDFPAILAVDDSASTDNATPVRVAVLDNDSGQGIELTAVGNPANGSAVIDSQAVVYTPDSDFVGTDTFTYTITDDFGQTDQATVTVTVADSGPPIDELIANDDSATTLQNQPVTVPVLDNDQGTGLTVTGVNQPANGTVSTDGTTVTYTPDTDFFGTDTFTYTVTDGDGDTDTATVVVTVQQDGNGMNNAPNAVDDSATTGKNLPVMIDVLANDSDPDGDPLTIISVSEVGTAFGRIFIENNRVIYEPFPGWFGGDEFQYTISDGRGGEDTATVFVTVDG